MTKEKKNKKRAEIMSATFAAEVKEPGYYRDHEEPNLKLRVRTTEITVGNRSCVLTTKSWILRVKIKRQDTHLGLGDYPGVTLEKARKKAKAAQKDIDAKRDPRHRKNPRLRQIAEQIIEERSASSKIWRGAGTRQRWENNLPKHIYPYLGDMRVTQITSAHIMAIVQPLMLKHPETGRQVLSHLRVIFARVKALNLRGDNPAEVVAAALPRSYRRHQPSPSVPCDQVAEVLRQIDASGAHWSTKAVCHMMAHTGARQKEIRGARWEAIDWDNATLNVPGDRTKSGKPQIIPLSGPVLALFDDAYQRTGGVGLVFPSRTGRPISDGTLSKLFRAHHLVLVPYGFRSSRRTWEAEHGVPDRVAELALGHTHKSVRPGVDLLEQRRAVAEQWSQYLTSPTTPN